MRGYLLCILQSQNSLRGTLGWGDFSNVQMWNPFGWISGILISSLGQPFQREIKKTTGLKGSQQRNFREKWRALTYTSGLKSYHELSRLETRDFILCQMRQLGRGVVEQIYEMRMAANFWWIPRVGRLLTRMTEYNVYMSGTNGWTSRHHNADKLQWKVWGSERQPITSMHPLLSCHTHPLLPCHAHPLLSRHTQLHPSTVILPCPSTVILPHPSIIGHTHPS